METISLKQLIKTGVITNMSKLRFNTNGYAFITFLQGSAAQNVYFGTHSGERITDKGYTDKTELKDIVELRDANIVHVANADGESRYKISISGSTDYLQESALMDIFGLETSNGNFDVVAFSKEFTSLQTTPADAKKALIGG